MTSSSDVVVVGAGVVGAAIAFYLAKSGAKVTLVDRDAPGGRTSRVSFGWINALGKRPEHYHRLSRLGVDAYTQLEEDLGPGSGIGHGGGLHWPSPDDAGRSEMASLVRDLEEFNYPYSLLTSQEAAELEPNVRVDGVDDGILYAPIERWADGDLLAGALAKQAVEYGASLASPVSVRELVTDGSRITGVATSDGFLSAGTVVVAAGTASVGLLAPLGYQLALGRVVGILGVVSAPAGAVSRVLYPGKYHLRPTNDGRVAIGCRDMDDLVDEDTDTSSPPSWMNQLLDMARRDCPALGGGQIEELRVGARPMPADGLPIVGPVPGVQGAYVAAMHSGVSLAAIVGQTLAGEIISGGVSPVLERYRPDRFSGSADTSV